MTVFLCIIYFLVLVLGVATGYLWGMYEGKVQGSSMGYSKGLTDECVRWRKILVQYGYGYYKMNAKDGSTQFVMTEHNEINKRIEQVNHDRTKYKNGSLGNSIWT